MGRKPGPIDGVVVRLKCPYCEHDQTAECWSPVDHELLQECAARVCRRSFVVRMLVTVEHLVAKIEGEDDVEYAADNLGRRVVKVDEPDNEDDAELPDLPGVQGRAAG